MNRLTYALKLARWLMAELLTAIAAIPIIILALAALFIAGETERPKRTTGERHNPCE